MELLDIVDENGIPTGAVIDRETAHREGIRHRTAHLWLLRRREGQVQVLLQKRSMEKDSYPGCYDISSAGHIPAGADFIPSALRELREELGLQVSRVYALWRDVEPEALTLQKEEVERVDWMDYDRCVQGVSEGSFPNCIRMDELEMLRHAWAVDSGTNYTNL